jgi:predicted phosphate transport protein (TIGR00153 family)
MFARLMPHEGRFFDLFNEHAEHVLQGSRELAALMATGDDIEHRVHAIESIEKRADRITRTTIELLHKTFITPLDRDDIHQLISKMDDILDLIEDSAQLIFLYDVQVPPPEAKKLADICVLCCEKVKSAVAQLSNMDNAAAILVICSNIDRLESEADHVMRAAMAKLFRDEPDVRQLIKLRTIYEHLETVTDRCEDVANIIEGVVLENS